MLWGRSERRAAGLTRFGAGFLTGLTRKVTEKEGKFASASVHVSAALLAVMFR